MNVVSAKSEEVSSTWLCCKAAIDPDVHGSRPDAAPQPAGRCGATIVKP